MAVVYHRAGDVMVMMIVVMEVMRMQHSAGVVSDHTECALDWQHSCISFAFNDALICAF